MEENYKSGVIPLFPVIIVMIELGILFLKSISNYKKFRA
jgi:hypothetical protein